MTDIKIFDSINELSIAAAEFIVEKSEEAIRVKNKFSIALSGGSTPNVLFSVLASEKYASKINWNRVFVFWGDERMVPSNDNRNNSFQAAKLLLNLMPIPKENIFPINTNLNSDAAAKNYEESIFDFFGNSNPVFDITLLGMGDNGHTASLFPHTSILSDKGIGVKSVFVEEINMYRVSFTSALINNSANIVFLVSGKNKAEMLSKVLEGEFLPNDYPAQLIKPSSYGNIYWFVDKDASSMLKKMI